MDFNFITSILKEFNPNALIGEDAHLEIAPYRAAMQPYSEQSIRKAAVLILLYPKNGLTHFTLIKRPTYDGTHSGQIALPGGKWEETDSSIIDTALREAKEETNIEENKVQVISRLTEIFIPPSNFKVTPVLATSTSTPNYIADEIEVESILEVALSDLLDQSNQLEKEMTFKNGITMNTPYFQLNKEVVWGATAMILNELKHYIYNASSI